MNLDYLERLLNFKVAFITLCLIMFLTSTNASELPKIYVVTEESYPSNYTDDNGEVRGFAADYLTYALEQENISYDISVYSWNRAYKMATQQENVIIFPIARTPEREPYFHWLHEIMTISYYLYGLSSRAQKYNESPDFQQYTIGVIAGGVTQKLVEELGFKNITLAKDYAQLNNLINKNRVDFIASSSFALLVTRYNYPEGYFKPYVKLGDREIKLFFALSRTSSLAVAENLQSVLTKYEGHLIVPE